MEAERLEAGVSVLQNVAEAVVVHALGDNARGSVHDEADAPLHIADEAVGDAVLGHVVGRQRACAIHEKRDDAAGRVGLGHGFEPVLVDPAFDDRAVDAPRGGRCNAPQASSGIRRKTAPL